jgi:hypothetical protein
MRISFFPLSLLAISCLFGCSDDGTGTSATTSLTSMTMTGATMDGSSTDGPDTTADGPDTTAEDPDTGDGDGDGGGDNFCVHQCTSDADCFAGGQDLGLTCVDSLCTSGSSSCTGDEECIALYSGWTTPCTSGGGECDGLGQVCIDVGLCAIPPTDLIACDVFMMEEIQTTDIDGNPVVVCAQPDAICNDDGYCSLPCASDADCASDAYPICDVATGVCQCSSDADCAMIGQPQYSVCNAGSCGCSEDQQCIDGNTGDICTAGGSCGCSGDMACAGVENPYDGGMISCVGL